PSTCCHCHRLLSAMLRTLRPPPPPLFPYTTLFRSQSAIDMCNRDQGGTVVIPAGDFVVGTVELKSNVTLHVAAAGRLLGSGKPEDRKSTRLNSSHGSISYAVFCLNKKTEITRL